MQFVGDKMKRQVSEAKSQLKGTAINLQLPTGTESQS